MRRLDTTSSQPGYLRQLKRRSACALANLPWAKGRDSSNGRRPLALILAGGGPVGLAAAAELKLALGGRASITIFEPRWSREPGAVCWKTESEGNRRREQVVTIQRNVIERLSPEVRDAVFPAGGYEEMWPNGPDSPRSVGRPRNVRIRDVEDRLLELVRGWDIELVCSRFDPKTAFLRHVDLIAVCDGTGSSTRAYFADEFGEGNTRPYCIKGSQLVDVVLGLRVSSLMPAPSSVALTIAQNRFLYNGMRGEGILNMRLTADEAGEVRGILPERQASTDCIQSSPCTMVAANSCGMRGFVCPTHGAIFQPSVDPSSFLWPRILQGLRLFDADLQSVTKFSVSMVQRDRYTAEVIGPDGRETFVALLGDAANAIHFWPGRGLNSGLLSALALVRTLSGRSGSPLRDADFTRYEAVMSALQHRHKSRAWRQMAVRRNGCLVAISEVIHQALSIKSPRDVLLADMEARCRQIIDRMEGRMDERPSLHEIMRRLERLDDQTLNVLVASGPWETVRSGGDEVDIDLYFPPTPGDLGSVLKCETSSSKVFCSR